MKSCPVCNKRHKNKLVVCPACRKRTILWRKKNPEKIRQSRKEWSEKNRDKVLKSKKKYRNKYSEKVKKQIKNWIKNNKRRYQQTKWSGWIKQKYGLSEKVFENLLKAQKGLCAICRNKQKCGKRKKLYVDHSHEAGVVRGLLCFKCNALLGMAQDDKSVLRLAIRYLGRRNATSLY
jgi:Recombination endonuclease VII